MKAAFLAFNIADVDFLISLQLPKDKQLVIAVRLSTYLYARLRGFRPVGMFANPFWAALGFGKAQEEGVDCQLYASLNMADSYARRSVDLHMRALNKVAAFAPDYVLLHGKFRLVEQAVLRAFTDACPLYFEPGPPGYSYFSLSGSNADADFRQSLTSSFKAQFDEKCQFVQSAAEEWARCKFVLRLIDYAYLQFLAKVLRNREVVDFLPKRKWFVTRNSARPSEAQHKLLFIGQVMLDANSTHYGCDIDMVLVALRRFLAHYPDTEIIVRPHPREGENVVNRAVLDKFSTQARLSSSDTLETAMAQANLVVTVNSTAGLEAVLAGKPVWVMGTSYYDGLDGVARNVDEAIALIQQSGVASEMASKQAQKFIDKCFLPIDYRGNKFPAVSGFFDLLANLKK